MNRRSALAVLDVMALLLGACAGTATLPPTAAPVSTSPAAPTATPASTASLEPSQSPPPACPNPHGGQCLGPLAAGTYSTVTFTPAITYTVPAGWGNYEDLPGNFLLIPPGGSMDGVDPGTSDYLGIYTSVAAEATECNAQPAPGVAQTAAGIAHALTTRPGITATMATTVTVAGLKGLVLDLKLKKGWTHSACSGTSPDVAMLLGMAPSEFEAAIGGTHDVRIYLLDNGDHVTAILIDDPSGGGHLKTFDPVVKSLLFGPG